MPAQEEGGRTHAWTAGSHDGDGFVRSRFRERPFEKIEHRAAEVLVRQRRRSARSRDVRTLFATKPWVLVHEADVLVDRSAECARRGELPPELGVPLLGRREPFRL